MRATDDRSVAAGGAGGPSEALRRVTAATMRALAHRPELELTLVADRAHPDASSRRDASLVRLVVPARDAPGHGLAALRGAADAVSLRLRFEEPAVQHRWVPAEPGARLIFEALERARCEARGALRMRGVACNLAAAIEERCRVRGDPAAAIPEFLSLAEATGMLAYERFTVQPLPALAGQWVSPVRPWIEARARDRLARLARLLEDPGGFAAVARRLAEDLAHAGDPARANAIDEDHAGSQPQESLRHRGGDETDSGETAPGDDVGGTGDSEAAGERLAGTYSERPWPVRAHGDGRLRRNRLSGGAGARYRIFTTEFDQVADASALCSAAELAPLRLKLDEQLGPFESTVARLARHLRRTVLARQVRTWESDQEEGALDPARLARVVVDPLYPLSKRREREWVFHDTVVQLLIDNSGSMRGQNIVTAAMSADLMARTLERCGVKVEILGFTTRAWKGGKSRERWLVAGRPGAPGRLNDLLHIVYKSADAPWRRARRALGLMLRDDLLKENIDGEALLWAHARLLQRAERRRIMVVISDGVPVDDSTLAANPGDCLEQHLHAVIEDIERRSPVELVAIGIGHDVSRFYRRALTLVDARELGGALLERLADLFRADSAPAAAVARRVFRGRASGHALVRASGRASATIDTARRSAL